MRLEFEPNVTATPLVENELFEEVGHSLTHDLSSLLKRGISAAQNGDRRRARMLLTEASQLDPRSEDAWMWLASISDYPEELLGFLNHVLEINPNNMRATDWMAATRSLLAATFVQRAVAAHEEGSDDLAQQCLDDALAHDNDCEMAWFWKASLAKSDDDKLEFLGCVLEINPENHEALDAVTAITRSRSQAAFEEAKDAAMSGNRQKAVELLDKFLKEVPGSVDAWLLKSHLSTGVNDKVEALEKALEIAPDNAAARAGLAFLALTFGSSKKQAEMHNDEPVEMSADDAPIKMEAAPVAEVVEAEEAAEGQGPLPEVSSPESIEPAADFSSMPTEESIVIEPAPEFEAAANDDGEPWQTTVVDEAPEWVSDEMPVEAEAVSLSAETVEDVSYMPETSAENDFADETVDVQQYDLIDSSEQVYEVEVEAKPAMVVDQYMEEENVPAVAQGEEHQEPVVEHYVGFACPFCASPNEPQAFECASCHATLTLSDIESLLSNPSVDRAVVQEAVTQMEAEWNLRDFNEQELTDLGIGYFNLHNRIAGFKYLQEASRLNPNNVMLAGHINTIAIRMDEMQRQAEALDLMPKGKTIMVVDDSPTVRKLISGKLEKSGHYVVCAVDGVEALERLAEVRPDLVLLDITMPRMDGYETCKKIRSNPDVKDIPVVMISGKDGFFDKVRGRMAGTSGYVTKPFGPETLMKALETFLLPDYVPEDFTEVSPAE